MHELAAHFGIDRTLEQQQGASNAEPRSPRFRVPAGAVPDQADQPPQHYQPSRPHHHPMPGITPGQDAIPDVAPHCRRRVKTEP